jgi:hypothetical protein
VTARPLFPPDAPCICGCRGRDHRVVWDGDIFVGTRCDAHGGHKFAFRPQIAPHPEKEPEP